MQRDIVDAVAAGQRDAEHALDRIGATQQGEAIAQAVNRIMSEQAGDRLAQHLGGRGAKMIADIGGHPAHLPVGRERDEEADRLDRALVGEWLPFAHAMSPHRLRSRTGLFANLKQRRGACQHFDHWAAMGPNTRSKITSMRRKW